MSNGEESTDLLRALAAQALQQLGQAHEGHGRQGSCRVLVDGLLGLNHIWPS